MFPPHRDSSPPCPATRDILDVDISLELFVKSVLVLTFKFDPDQTAARVLHTHEVIITLDVLPLAFSAVVGGFILVHGADPVLGHEGGILNLSDQSPLVTVAALDVGARVHDTLQLILLQLPDFLDGSCLLLDVLFVENVG